MWNLVLCDGVGMGFHELLEVQQGDRRKYHDDVSIIIVSLEGKIWRSSAWVNLDLLQTVMDTSDRIVVEFIYLRIN